MSPLSDPPSVLLVDDDQQTARMVQQILSEYQVRLARDAAAAREAVWDELPDVILLDIMLPDESGLDLLVDLHSLAPDVPVVIVTAYGTMDRAVQALREHAYDFVQKPFQVEVLLAAVRRALTYRTLVLNRLQATEALQQRTAALQAAHRQISALQSVALIGQLAQGLMHEIANPLSVIRVNVNLLNKTLELAPDQGGRLVNVMEATQRIEKTIKMLRVFSYTPEAPQEVALDEVVEVAITQLANTGLLQTCRVQSDLPPDLPPIVTRREQIFQAIRNILINAEEAASRDMQPGCQIDISAAVEDDYIRLTLANNGPPIPREDLVHVFNPMFTTKQDEGRVRGLGLGLFMARTVVEANGGHLEIESGRPRGVQVRIFLPLDGPGEDGSDP